MSSSKTLFDYFLKAEQATSTHNVASSESEAEEEVDQNNTGPENVAVSQQTQNKTTSYKSDLLSIAIRHVKALTD